MVVLATAHLSRRAAPSALAVAFATSDGSRTAARSTSHIPSTKSATDAAASSASRVLPTPPGPVSVSSRVVPSRRRTSARSSRLPRNVVRAAGRFPTSEWEVR